MVEVYGPNYHGRLLVRQLRAFRESSGLTQEDAAVELRLTVQKISRIETGQIPGYHEMLAMLKLYKVPANQRAAYETLLTLAQKRGWWCKLGLRNSDYVALEDEAAAMVEFQLGFLPELMQTEGYARELAGRLTPNPDLDADRRLAALLRRQQRLDADDARCLPLHSIVYEPVLQGVDRAQVRNLIDCASLPHVVFQILPVSAGFHPGLAGSMILLTFDNPIEPRHAFRTDIFGEFRSLKESDTYHVGQALKDLEQTALSPDESLSVLKRRAGKR